MEKQFCFHTLLSKVKDIECSKCVDPKCNIVSFSHTSEPKAINMVVNNNFYITIMKQMYNYLSSNLVVAAAWKTMSISCIISCTRLESLTPILFSDVSPGTGTTFSEIRAFKVSSPILFLNTLNKSFSKTCFKVKKESESHFRVKYQTKKFGS